MKSVLIAGLFLTTLGCHTAPIPNPAVPPITVAPKPTPGPFDYTEKNGTAKTPGEDQKPTSETPTQ